jgi:hypothetical protein
MKQKPLKINTPLIYSRNLLLAPISAWIPPDSDQRLLKLFGRYIDYRHDADSNSSSIKQVIITTLR